MKQSAIESVLVIDSDWRALVTTQKALEKAGYRVLTRDRASGAVATIVREKPKLLLVEPDMPVISGEALIKILRGSDPRPETLLLLHSDLPFHELHQRSVWCGADGYVQKTDSTARMIWQINQWVGRAREKRHTGHLKALTDVDAPPETPIAREKTPTAPPVNSSRPRILFVDDDPSILRAYRREISADEFDCVFSTSGEQAFVMLEGHTPPDVIVCDLLMPGLSGPDLYAKAVDRERSWRKRFLFTTGFGSVQHISSFIKTVDVRVFRKPLAMPALLESIRYAALRARIFRPGSRAHLAKLYE
jgi:DNA-binding NtrC family response regulator